MTINLKGNEGFCIVQGDHSLEANRLSIYCLLNDIPLKKVKIGENYNWNLVPCGSVEWCLWSLRKEIKPDYYPVWLQDLLHRKVWEDNKWILGRKLFVKPSDRYKRFTGFVTTGTYSKKKKPPFWYSEVIYFENEWRYYITDGIITSAGWYWGDEVNTPEPPVHPALEALKCIPKDFCGAIDFGMTKDGKFALIEVQHPFACGWYGTQEYDESYFQWLIDGWNYMRELK